MKVNPYKHDMTRLKVLVDELSHTILKQLHEGYVYDLVFCEAYDNILSRIVGVFLIVI